MTDYIHASNGDGPARTGIVTTARGIGSTQLITDTVLNWPSRGIALSEDVAGTNKTVFRYHLDGSIITIESFAPGYFDIGNEIDQIVTLKPNTEWANAVADRVNEIELGAQWLNGSGVPSGALGNDGDYYINTANNDVYTKSSGSWGSPILNITGATGATGATGSTGATGTAGSTWYQGAGAPSGGTGVNGDYYLNTSTGGIYLKSSGTWSVIVTLTSTDTNAIHKDGTTSTVSADIPFNAHKLTGLANPTLAQDAATKAYVDGRTPDYSTSETDTGKKWIDGRTVYRKVIQGTVNITTAGGSAQLTHSISGLTNSMCLVSLAVFMKIGQSSGTTQNAGQTNTYFEGTGTPANLAGITGFNSIGFDVKFGYGGWGTTWISVVAEYVK